MVLSSPREAEALPGPNTTRVGLCAHDLQIIYQQQLAANRRAQVRIGRITLSSKYANLPRAIRTRHRHALPIAYTPALHLVPSAASGQRYCLQKLGVHHGRLLISLIAHQCFSKTKRKAWWLTSVREAACLAVHKICCLRSFQIKSAHGKLWFTFISHVKPLRNYLF